jgi:hypothetical protein
MAIPSHRIYSVAEMIRSDKLFQLQGEEWVSK